MKKKSGLFDVDFSFTTQELAASVIGEQVRSYSKSFTEALQTIVKQMEVSGYRTRTLKDYDTVLTNFAKCTDHYTDSTDIVGFDIEQINDLGIEELSHNNAVGTFYTAKKFRIFKQDGIDKFLELKKEEDDDNLMSWVHSKEESYRKLYIRGVFVKHISIISNENALKHIVINEIKINILNESIIPTVNRNSIKETDEEIINNSIYIAICLHIIDNTSDESEKTLLRNYLVEYMDFSKSLIKEEYKNNK